MNHTAFAKNMVEQYNISATSTIPGSPGVDLGPRKDGEPGGNEEFPKYRALVGSLMWLSVMTRPDMRTHFAPAHVIVIILVRPTGRRLYK